MILKFPLKGLKTSIKKGSVIGLKILEFGEEGFIYHLVWGVMIKLFSTSSIVAVKLKVRMLKYDVYKTFNLTSPLVLNVWVCSRVSHFLKGLS